jgi:hypothetical protein
MDDSMEVGLIGSTLRTGKPATWGSDQQGCDKTSDKADTLRSGKHDDKET